MCMHGFSIHVIFKHLRTEIYYAVVAKRDAAVVEEDTTVTNRDAETTTLREQLVGTQREASADTYTTGELLCCPFHYPATRA